VPGACGRVLLVLVLPEDQSPTPVSSSSVHNMENDPFAVPPLAITQPATFTPRSAAAEQLTLGGG